MKPRTKRRKLKQRQKCSSSGYYYLKSLFLQDESEILKWPSYRGSSLTKCSIVVLFIQLLLGSGALASSYPSSCHTPPNSRLIHNLVISSYKIQCDEGFELFGGNGDCANNMKDSSYHCATNVSPSLPTNQSSTQSKQSSNLANDGNISTCSQTMRELNPFWKIDLLTPHHITGIRLTTNMSNTTTDLEIRVGSNPLGLKNPLCVWQPSTILNGTILFPCSRPLTGRHLSIQIIGGEASVLNLCEVEVFATDGVPKSRCGGSDDDEVVSFNGECYGFAVKGGKTFSSARETCSSHNGTLPTERHLKQGSPNFNLITTVLDRLKPILKRQLLWIGVERDPTFTSRTWRWSDTSLVIKKPNWGKDQPNNYNGEQNCAVLDGGRDWSWNDVGCGLDLFQWICVHSPTRCGSPEVKLGTGIDEVDNYAIGHVLQYKCTLPGHFVDTGDSHRHCLLNGSWNGTAPTCKYIECGSVNSTLPNGDITLPNVTHYGSQINYKCHEGYRLENGQELTRLCLKNGSWSGPSEPQCLKSSCEDAVNVVNGTFKSSGNSVGDTIHYTCNEGHVLVGSPVLTCKLGGVYDNGVPSCKYVECGEMPALENGSFKLNGSSGLGSVAVANCEPDYELEDERNDRIECQSDGKWAGKNLSLIKCQLITCPEPLVPPGSFVTGYDFTIHSEIQYHCEEGHVMIGGNEIRRCTPGKVWSGRVPECRFTDCPRSQTIPFGQLTYPSGKTYVNSTVEYSCAPNFKLLGPKIRTCTPLGTWSGSLPKCEEIRCSFPQLPPNSVATVAKNDRWNSQSLIKASEDNNSTFKIGTVLRLRCERGYVLEGERTMVCNEGQWNVNTAKCRFVDCGEADSIENGFKTGNATVYGSVIVYECEKGYELKGGNRRVCQEDGVWSGVKPGCEETTCGPDLQPTNATVEYTGYKIGNLARYSCAKGSYLHGDGTRECLSSGKWSGSSPNCRLTTCPSPPPTAPHARQFLVNTSTVYSSIVEYHCMTGYVMVEAFVVTCTEFGKWDPPEGPRCLTREEYSKYESSNSSSIIAIVLGLSVGFLLMSGVLGYILWRKRQDNEVKNATTSPESKGQPMVMLTDSIPNPHYYDNPTNDPIYENLDDYDVVGGVQDNNMVTINGVAV